MSAFDAPIPLSDIESVLAWVDMFKLSRGTKKINRDFSDAVLLAEILNVYYPKLVEMHNYPPRNSHALKLNNWMTLNRKVLRKLKLNLCCATMEQLANSAPGVIERVLLMVREKIRRDEELNKSKEATENEMSSGGSYYEACGEDEHVLMVPVKSRVNGVLEVIQQKVVSHDMYLSLKQELQDVKDCNEVLKNKVEHLDNLLKLKDQRIEELQKQLERKQNRRKEVEVLQNSLCAPFEPSPPTPKLTDSLQTLGKSASIKFSESISKIPVDDNKSTVEPKASKSEHQITSKSASYTLSGPIKLLSPKSSESIRKIPKLEDFYLRVVPKVCKLEDKDFNLKSSDEKILKVESIETVDSEKDVVEPLEPKKSLHALPTVKNSDSAERAADRIDSNIFKEIEIVEQKSEDYFDEFKDSVEDVVVTIEESIKNEVKEITNPLEFSDQNYIA